MPQGEALSLYAPTGATPSSQSSLSPVLVRFASHSLPQGNSRPFSPRAAFSHSASVGRRCPRHVQKAFASFQLTPVTGNCSMSLGGGGGAAGGAGGAGAGGAGAGGK